ncbi:MAG: MmcQ/YjbR family DNA-binding protein [Clostridia bacterium]|nr:MmcQ/YjbR family DNA-binding protein [Clostridia bacterium]
MKKTSLREKVFEYAREKYGSEPEYLWMKYPDYAVLRHNDNQKWYGVVMNVSPDKIGRTGTGRVDILNVKIDDAFLFGSLLPRKGFSSGYHMNRMNWISVSLDGAVQLSEICALLDMSFASTASTGKKRLFRAPKEWIVPANPKYYDVQRAFDENEEIDWKQGAGIREGDTVYMYVAAPVSAILYRCEVTKTGIPFDYVGDGLTIRKLMKIKLLKRYDCTAFTFEKLRDRYGIFAVRGPRGVPHALGEALKKYE